MTGNETTANKLCTTWGNQKVSEGSVTYWRKLGKSIHKPRLRHGLVTLQFCKCSPNNQIASRNLGFSISDHQRFLELTMKMHIGIDT